MSADPYRYFRVEAADLLAELRKGALDLSRGENAAAPVRRLLRASHTFKSAARVVRLVALGDRAHAMEDLLAPLRDREAPASAEVTDALEAHLAVIEEGLAAIAIEAPSRDLGAAGPTSTSHDDPTGRDAVRVLRAEVSEVDELVEGLGTAHVEVGALRESLAELAHARQLAEVLVSQLAPRATTSPEVRAHAHALAGDIRGALGDLERMLAAGIERVTRELGESREAAERLRLVPAGVLLDALERTTLDAGRAVGRRVRFHATGREVRLDAHVLALAQDALVQIVRNAVAHGLESEAERSRAGKPIEGLVTITIERRAGRLVLGCRDDGRGVDLEGVRRAARRKGVLPSGTGPESAEALLGMLISGGLSTSTQVTAIAGRGIGMDVVRSAAARLGGEVRVRTQPGHGTDVELVVPLALSALDVLLVRIHEQTFGFAIDAVRATRRVLPGEVAATAEGEAIIDGGRAIPFASLARCLGLATREGSASATSAVVVRGASDEAALGVDRLLGTAHLLLRPVPELAPVDDTVAGVALDAAGDAIIVLDATRVVARARGAPRRVASAREVLPILVVDDSLTTRMLEQSILESAGYRVELATSGEDALAKLALARYALMLVDVEMPGIDGFEVIRRVRADASVRELPAILVTSRDAPEDRALGRTVGANDYVVKGEFDQSLLLARIRELVA
jgi:two-component system chemotaxis sensor kinase CheA